MVASYDHTVHRTIGIPPAEVTWANQTTGSKRLYGRKGHTISCTLSPGDGKEVHVVFFEKRLKYSVDKFGSFVCL
jgi:hypothetical protein